MGETRPRLLEDQVVKSGVPAVGAADAHGGARSSPVGDQRDLLVGVHRNLHAWLAVAGRADGARNGSPIEGGESHKPPGGDEGDRITREARAVESHAVGSVGTSRSG